MHEIASRCVIPIRKVSGTGARVDQLTFLAAVVAASRERISPLKAALDSGLVNALISDSVTCQELLKG